MNLASWIILAIIILVVFFIVRGMVKKSKSGMAPTCGCGCSNCSMNCSQKK